MAIIPSDAEFDLASKLLGRMTAIFCLGRETERNLDYRCLYVLILHLPAGALSCLFISLEFHLFLLLSVTFYYFLIKKTKFKYVPVYILHLLFPFRVTSNFISLCTRQSRARRISSLAAADNIFLIRDIDKVIKPITERVR